MELSPHQPLPARDPEQADDTSVYARIEGLIGEEDALLKLPIHQLTPARRERLRVVQQALDGIWEQLRDRAARAGA